jgi:hypothetical protein
MGNCRRSCKSCQGGDRAWQLRAKIAEGYDTPATPGTPGAKLKNYSTTNVTIKSAALDHLEVVGYLTHVYTYGLCVCRTKYGNWCRCMAGL